MIEGHGDGRTHSSMGGRIKTGGDWLHRSGSDTSYKMCTSGRGSGTGLLF
jgi:hypothetical protein